MRCLEVQGADRTTHWIESSRRTDGQVVSVRRREPLTVRRLSTRTLTGWLRNAAEEHADRDADEPRYPVQMFTRGETSSSLPRVECRDRHAKFRGKLLQKQSLLLPPTSEVRRQAILSTERLRTTGSSHSHSPQRDGLRGIGIRCPAMGVKITRGGLRCKK